MRVWFDESNACRSHGWQKEMKYAHEYALSIILVQSWSMAFSECPRALICRTSKQWSLSIIVVGSLLTIANKDFFQIFLLSAIIHAGFVLSQQYRAGIWTRRSDSLNRLQATGWCLLLSTIAYFVVPIEGEMERVFVYFLVVILGLLVAIQLKSSLVLAAQNVVPSDALDPSMHKSRQRAD